MKNPEVQSKKEKSPIVLVANGPGSKPITVPYEEGDTVASVIARAGITIEEGSTATLGKMRVKNPEKTAVAPNDLVVIAGMPSNG